MMKMEFYTPAHGVSGEFGAASFGFAGAEDETVSNKVVCPIELRGTVVSGSYEECIRNIPEGTWQAGIVLMGNAGGENEFIRTLAEKVNAPLTGGSAAINPVTGERALITGRGQATVFLIDDDRYKVEVVSKNIHHNVLGEYKIAYSGRWIDEIDGCEPKQWLMKQKEKFGFRKEDFEHVTFSDEHGINVHLSEVDGRIFSGRDLCETMFLRYIPHEEVQNEIQEFYNDKDAVIFGCAGLKGILDSGLQCGCTGLFMFGEVCTMDGHSDFGNLMLSKLRVTKI